MHAIWSPGWLISVIALSVVTGIFLLGFVVFLAYWIYERKRSDWYASSAKVFSLGSLAAATAFAIILAVVAFPYAGQYHRFVPVTGTVQHVSSRFLSGGSGGTDQKFAVVIGGQTYGVNDTRASSLHRGDVVTIMCERTWQWAGTPGWDCNWGRLVSRGR